MSAEEFTGLGFALGSVKGVRSFRVDKFGRLTGVTYRQVWVPSENHAECRRDESYTFGSLWGSSYSFVLGGSAPAFPVQAHSFETCGCGFYGYFDNSDDFHESAMVTAVVEGYGETIIGTRGFRAIKARILALRVKAETDDLTRSMANKVSRNYAGVALFDDFDRMVSEFPPSTSLEPSAETDPDFWNRSI